MPYSCEFNSSTVRGETQRFTRICTRTCGGDLQERAQLRLKREFSAERRVAALAGIGIRVSYLQHQRQIFRAPGLHVHVSLSESSVHRGLRTARSRKARTCEAHQLICRSYWAFEHSDLNFDQRHLMRDWVFRSQRRASVFFDARCFGLSRLELLRRCPKSQVFTRVPQPHYRASMTPCPPARKGLPRIRTSR